MTFFVLTEEGLYFQAQSDHYVAKCHQRIASFYFVETILFQGANDFIKESRLESSIQKLKKSLTFKDIPTSRAVTSSGSVRAVEKFIRKKIEKAFQ